MKTNNFIAIALSLFIMLTSACGTEPDKVLSAEELGKIAAKIKNNPPEANTILEENGMTRKEFEKKLRKISQNPDAASRYRRSFESHLQKTN